MSKPIWQSKTFWFNLVFLLLGIVTAVAHYFGYGEWEPAEDVQQILFVVVLAINILLRFITKQPVTL